MGDHRSGHRDTAPAAENRARRTRPQETGPPGMGPLQPRHPRPALPVCHRYHRAPAARGARPGRHLLPQPPARRRPADRRQDRGWRDRPAGVPLGSAGAAAARS